MMTEPRRGRAPSDREAMRAWRECMSLAERHALVAQAYGGVAVLMLPEEQRKIGRRGACLMAAGFDPYEAEEEAEA